MKLFSSALLVVVAVCVVPAYAGVTVSSPTDGGTFSSNVPFVVTANTDCSGGVAAVGIYVDDVLKYVVNGNSMNTSLYLSPGTHRAVVKSWDYCGDLASVPMTINVNNDNGVSVSTPTDESTVGTSVNYVASANTTCSAGVAKMGIYVNDQLTYVTSGASLNTQLTLSPGRQKTVVQEWDLCGGSSSARIDVNVGGGGGGNGGGGGGGGGSTLYNIQAWGGFNQWGELPPVYDICNAGSCPGVDWSMYQHIGSNSLSGDSTQYNVGGWRPYSDVLWSKKIMGQGADSSLADRDHSMIPTLHDFTFDAYVYPTNMSVTQDLEFDANMYISGVGMEWGTQCNYLADGQWDIWSNAPAHWMPTGIPCRLNENSWNHIVLQFHRNWNNDVVYQTITVNGNTYNVNRTVGPMQVPYNWWGMTVNYQMDGDHHQSWNTTYLDKWNFTYR